MKICRPRRNLLAMWLFARALLFVLPSFVFLTPPLLASQQIERKKVLVLFSFRPTLPVAYQWDRGIQSVFEPSTSHKMVVNIEYLDLMHFDDERYIQILLDIFQYKYSKPKPDLIIPVFNSAVALVLKHGPDLFPGVPIVFGGVESKFVENRSLGPNVTGYLTDNNYTGTLDLALNLHPDTRHVAVVAGAGPIGRGWSKACREAFKAYEERVDFTYLIGLPLEALLEKLANLSAHTVVFSLPVLQDGAGKNFIGNESLSQITRVSSAPVYSFRDVNIGTGIVGGYMSSFEEDGKAVAQLGLRILNGEQPEDIPITRAPTFLYMFDWRQLKRWSIAEDKLPQGSIIKFKQLTIWDMYKGRIIGAFAMILLQALIIFYLLHQRRIRRQSEENLLQTEEKYRTVADYTYDWEYWQNPDGSLQYISPSCERICGYPAQDLLTNPSLLQDMIVPEDKAAWDEHRCSVQKDMRSEEIQFRIQKPDGEIRWIEHACQPVFDHKGNNQGIRVSNRDITKRAFYRSETHKLQSELAHMDRVVTISTLTSAMAHEINQPLAAMRSYAQAALRFMDKDHPEYDSARKALQGIVADNKRAAAVVNRLRDLVKKGPTHWETIEINSIINDVIGFINSEVVLRNASITLDLYPIVPVVQGDSVQIQQVLINLLTNALDAVEDQPIEARTLTISTRPENSNGIIVSISDSGGGIPPDTIEAIFSPFHTTKSTGMGLGLSICKSIIEAHGGKIWVENNPDGGAIFSLILPAGSQTV
ncbi:MAG: ATP-binding protein [Deltaproteobacteria bacterium]|nr:ATP-binding protein [Deltaproteobacteria bacterium]MDH3851022.1 ATP-binding protein [Deltaproteobacteria bacterium]MDH3928072.1 ATP-binding protein [Deltaproteobacteria bacterium]